MKKLMYDHYRQSNGYDEEEIKKVRENITWMDILAIIIAQLQIIMPLVLIFSGIMWVVLHILL